MHRRRFVQLGIAAVALGVLGFATTGLSRLAIADRAATLLGAPFVVAGFALAVAGFALAVLAGSGVVELERDPER